MSTPLEPWTLHIYFASVSVPPLVFPVIYFLPYSEREFLVRWDEGAFPQRALLSRGLGDLPGRVCLLSNYVAVLFKTSGPVTSMGNATGTYPATYTLLFLYLLAVGLLLDTRTFRPYCHFYCLSGEA